MRKIVWTIILIVLVVIIIMLGLTRTPEKKTEGDVQYNRLVEILDKYKTATERYGKIIKDFESGRINDNVFLSEANAIATAMKTMATEFEATLGWLPPGNEKQKASKILSGMKLVIEGAGLYEDGVRSQDLNRMATGKQKIQDGERSTKR